jgi:hypothetical protein
MPAAKPLRATNTQRSGRGSGGVTGKGFRPGVSGNPGGTSKESVDVAAIARQHTAAAITALVRALDDPKVCVPAAVAILNRGHGMPPAKIEGVTPQSITILHLVAARAVTDEIMRALADNGSAAPTLDAESSQEPSDLYTPALE